MTYHFTPIPHTDKALYSFLTLLNNYFEEGVIDTETLPAGGQYSNGDYINPQDEQAFQSQEEVLAFHQAFAQEYVKAIKENEQENFVSSVFGSRMTDCVRLTQKHFPNITQGENDYDLYEQLMKRWSQALPINVLGLEKLRQKDVKSNEELLEALDDLFSPAFD